MNINLTSIFYYTQTLPTTFQASTKQNVSSMITMMRPTLLAMLSWYLPNVHRLFYTFWQNSLALLFPEALVGAEGDEEVVVEDNWWQGQDQGSTHLKDKDIGQIL